MSDLGKIPAAASALLSRRVRAFTERRRRKRLEAQLAANLRDIGKHALEVAFNDADLTALEAKAREVWKEVDEKEAAISAVEGAPMPQDAEAARREEKERRERTRGLRAGLAAHRAEADRRLGELGTRVLAQKAPLDPRLLPSVEWHRRLEAERDALAAKAERERAAWHALPPVARIGAQAVHVLALLLVAGLVATVLYLGGGADEDRRARLPLPPGEGRGEGVPLAPVPAPVPAPAAAGTPTTAPQPPHPNPLPDGRGSPAPTEPVRAKEPPLRFAGTIESTGERDRHPLTVAPEIPAVTIDAAPHHVGDEEVRKWEVPKHEGAKVVLPFRLERVPEGVCELALDLYNTDNDDSTVRVNGGPAIALPRQREEKWAPSRFRILPSWLKVGENEVLFEASAPHGNADDFMVRSVRLEPGPILYRLTLSKVPGVDTRLSVFVEGGAGAPVAAANDTVVGEEVLPNVAIPPGAYAIEVSGDGKNAEVPYDLAVERVGPLGPGDEREPNGTLEAASPIELDRPMSGYLGASGDQDFYALRLAEDSYVGLSLGAVPGVDLLLQVKDERGYQLVVEVNTGGAGEPDETELLKLAAGEYRLIVAAHAQSPGRANPRAPYRLAVRRAAAQAGFEEEPNNDARQARPLPLGKSLRGRLDPAEDRDWYTFTVEETPSPQPSPGGRGSGALAKISVSGIDGVALQIWLENEYGDPPPGRAGDARTVTNWPVAKGEHRFGVGGKSGRGAVDRRQTYRVKVELLAKPEGDYTVGNNDLETAAAVTPDDTLRSALYPWEDEDWYRIAFADADLVYRLKPVQMSLGRLGVEIFDAERKKLLTVAGTPLENWTPEPGSYYLRVYRLQGGRQQEDYAFRLQEERLLGRDEEREQNDTRERATPLPEETLVAAYLAPMSATAQDEDWYRIDVGAANAGKVYALEVEYEPKQLDVALTLVDAAGKAVFPTRNEKGPGAGERLENWAPAPGAYFVRVHVADEYMKNAPYTVRWRETGRRSSDMEFEPNNAVDGANELKLDLVVKGRIATKDDQDVFKVVTTKPAPEVMRIKVTGDDEIHRVHVVDAAGKDVAPELAPRGGVLEVPGYVLAAAGQALYVSVRADAYRYRASDADYSIVATEVGAWTEGREAEPNSDWAHAARLPPDREVTGEIGFRGDVECFMWEVPAKPEPEPRYYTLTIRPPDDLSLQVDIDYSADGKEWRKLFDRGVDGRRQEVLVVPNVRARPGTYRIELKGWGEASTRPYAVGMESQLAGRDPAKDVEWNNPVELGEPLVPGEPVVGHTHFHDDWDQYLVDATAGAGKPYRLGFQASEATDLDVRIYRRDEKKQWIELKRIHVEKGGTAALERFEPAAAGLYAIAVKGDYVPGAGYELHLDEAAAAAAADPEPNDRGEEAMRLEAGQAARGRIDHKGDQDAWRLDVAEGEAAVFALRYAGPAKPALSKVEGGETSIAVGVDDGERRGDGIQWLWDLRVPEGKTYADDLFLEAGAWYFVPKAKGQAAGGEYRLELARAPEPAPAADRIYEPGTSRYRPREVAIDRPLRGRFLPYGSEDWDGVRFTLAEAAALEARLEVAAGADGWLVLHDEKGRGLAEVNQAGDGGAERLYAPKLEPGAYVLDVRGRCKADRDGDGAPNEALEYRLVFAKAEPGYVFPEKRDDPGLDIASASLGGRIVRSTSSYGDGYRAENLIDVAANDAWCSKDGALPQEIVIGFSGGRATTVDLVGWEPVDYYLDDVPKTVEVLVSKAGGGGGGAGAEAWESVARVELPREAKPFAVALDPPRDASEVMLRIVANHGGGYTRLERVRVREAVPGHRSVAAAEHAIPLGASDFSGGVNALAAALGAKVVSVTSEYGSSWSAANLLDGVNHTPGWCTKDAKGPFEAVLALAGTGAGPVEVDRLILSPTVREDWHGAVREVELWASPEPSPKESDFAKVASFSLDPHEPWQTYALPAPVKARFLKLRALSNHGGSYFLLGELAAVRR